MSRILVTGGAGFIGSHLVDALINKSHQVTVIDDLSIGKRKFVNSNAILFKKRIQASEIKNIFKSKRFDTVFHLAAQKDLQYSKKYPVKDAETNIIGGLNIIQVAKENKIRKLIFFSTAAVYNPKSRPPNYESDCLNPITPYGITKAAIEQYLKNSGLSYSILRLSNVYGPRQDAVGEGGVISIFCSRLVRNKEVMINNTGKQTRDLIFVGDIITAAIKSINKGDNKTLNISSGKEFSINNLYSLLAKISESTGKPARGRRVIEQYRSSLSNTLAKKYLDWRVNASMLEGLKITYNWFRDEHEKK